MAGTTITALIIGALGVRVRERDSVVGITMAFGLGLGVLFLSLYPPFATQAFAILFGSITGVSRGDVALLIGIGVVTLVALAVIYRPLTFATVDPEVAEARGVPVGQLAIAFLLIMAAAVAEAVQVVGVLLILTLLITPGATAERLTVSPVRATVYSILIALSVEGGILLALATNLPVSVYVTSLSFAGYLAARFIVGPMRGSRASVVEVRLRARLGGSPSRPLSPQAFQSRLDPRRARVATLAPDVPVRALVHGDNCSVAGDRTGEIARLGCRCARLHRTLNVVRCCLTPRTSAAREAEKDGCSEKDGGEHDRDARQENTRRKPASGGGGGRRR